MTENNLDLFASGRDEPDEAASGRADSQPVTPEDQEAPGPTVWTVSQVNRAVRKQLEQGLPNLWVSGEIANFTQQRSGHCYFTLKDDASQLRCVLFRREAARLPALPEEGMSVKVFGGLTLYEARGSYQMVVSQLELSDVEGLWKLAFERTRRKLEAEGLMDPSRKRALPRFPRRIGVVTSPTGAALRDVLSVAKRRAPWLRVVLRGSRVQGEGAGLEIAHAIRTLVAMGDVELVIVTRGGGSIEDLWGFNEEAVARAIADCPIPVISGVGHEVDVTIADLVADVRAATPSAAAEAAAPDQQAIQHLFANARRRLATGLAGQVQRRRWRLERAAEAMNRSARERVPVLRRRVEGAQNRIEALTRRRLAEGSARLAELSTAVDARSPLSTLARGYAVPLDEGRVLRTIGDFQMGSDFRLRVVDGTVPCQVSGEGAPA
ncbi:MAG: exodeoxyribonuclease VII large subunit [Longimicrobiales bacterium]